MPRLNRESESMVIQAGYISTEEPIFSDGEHFTRFFGRYHAACNNHPLCSPNRNGALIGKDGEGENGFDTLAELLDFIARRFPEHFGHITRFIVPKSDVDP
jgi:hypothetical protein